MNQPSPVDCLRCRHYFVTYDPALPRGCRIFQIKSKALPSRIIEDSSGEPCRGFEPKLRGGTARHQQ